MPALGTFIYNNYRQATRTVCELAPQLHALCKELKCTPEDFERYLDDERCYLDGLRSEPAQAEMKFQYLDALQRLEMAMYAFHIYRNLLLMEHFVDRAKHSEAKSLQHAVTYNNSTESMSQAGAVHISLNTINALNKVLGLQEQVGNLEIKLGLERRWTKDSAEYREAMTELGMRRYRLALDRLERLVIQRLFELTKIGMSGVGRRTSSLNIDEVYTN